jgi:uracil-DNA glycosylase family protein
MAARSHARVHLPRIPASHTLEELRETALHCKACPLWRSGTQTVFGEGPRQAPMMLIGEQPGHEEDLSGHPFVGPAGKLLDGALSAAGIDRTKVYVTNVVKHFKWVPKGKRRLHQKPNAREIGACIPWLDAELDLVKPSVLVCLGATAAQALFGRAFRVSTQRGVLVPFERVPYALATAHPSSILRSPSVEEREYALLRMIEDLRVAAEYLPGAR